MLSGTSDFLTCTSQASSQQQLVWGSSQRQGTKAVLVSACSTCCNSNLNFLDHFKAICCVYYKRASPSWAPRSTPFNIQLLGIQTCSFHVQPYPARSKTWASATTFFVQMLVLYGSEIAWKVAQAALVRAADPTPAAQWGTGATGSPSDKSPTCRGLEQTPLHALCYTLPFDRASNKCSLQIHSCSWPPLEGVLLN